MLNFQSISTFNTTDIRIDTSQFSQLAPDTLYCRKDDVNNVSQEAISNSVTAYYYPAAPVNCKIISDDAGDNQQITIYYYADATSELPEVQNVTLDGTNEVTVPNAIFRGRRMVVTSISGLNNGTITLYEDGSPGNIISSMSPEVGFSMDSYIYCPANTKVLLKSLNVLTNANNSKEFKIYAYRYPVATIPTYFFKVQEYSVGNTFHLPVETQPMISSGTTYELFCNEQTGAGTVDATVSYEFLFFK